MSPIIPVCVCVCVCARAHTFVAMNLTVSTLMDSELENKFQDFLSLGEL
jgi:hypothetical protein